MGHANLATRAHAAHCYFMANGVMRMAMVLFEQGWDKDKMTAVETGDALRKFIKYQVDKLMQTGTLDDRAHPAPPRKVSDEVAKECSDILKKGYFCFLTNAQGGQLNEEAPVHLYYTSIKQAVEDQPQLKAACTAHNVTPEHLLKRMHEVDPELKYYTLDLKQALTDEQMEKRRFCAQVLYNWATSDPNFLLSVIYIDEFSFSFIPLPKHIKIKIYCGLNDDEVRHHVVHNPYASSSQPHIKVRSIIFTNALLGAFRIEMMTGTTGIRRLLNPRTAPYMVSHMIALHPMVQ